MKDLFRISLRPFQSSDEKMLERWRKEFNGPDSLLELPNGYKRDIGVITDVAISGDKRVLGSFTATMVAVLDPLIRNPNAAPHESLQAAFALTRGLEVQAARAGALEAYIAISNEDPGFQELVQKCGFVETAQNCKIFRHQFFPPETKVEAAKAAAVGSSAGEGERA